MARPDAASAKAEPILIKLSSVEPRPVQWLWPGRIALGKLTLLVGDPGQGKSAISIDMAARISTGREWPDGTDGCHGSVLLMSAEDDLTDTIRPRLDSAGGDPERVTALAGLKIGEFERDITLRDIDLLEEAIDSMADVRLVIVDPISAYMGDADSHKNADVRGVLAPLAKLAAERGVAVVAVTHLRKGEGQMIYRAMGSLAFIAAARMAWAVVPHPSDAAWRVIARVKGNIGADPGALAFKVVATGDGPPSIEWKEDRVDIDLDAPPQNGTQNAERRSALNETRAWLSDLLKNGRVAAGEIKAKAKADGLSWRTIERAKTDLQIVARHEGGSEGRWMWSLPQRPPTPPSDDDTTDVGGLGGLYDPADGSGDDHPPANYWETGA